MLTLASASTLFASLSLLALLSKEAYTTNAITLSSSVNRRELECTDPLLLLEGKGSFDPFFPLGSVLGVMVKFRWKRQDEERGRCNVWCEVTVSDRRMITNYVNATTNTVPSSKFT